MRWEIDGTIIGIEDFGSIHSCVGVWPSRNNTHNITTSFFTPATLPSILTNTPPPPALGSNLLLAKVDGFWEVDERGKTIAGIGGFVRETNKGGMCYIFSGPATCDSSKAAAVAAISHILGAIIDTNRIDREIQVHLDAKEVVQDIKNISQGSKPEKEMKEVDDQIKKIPRLRIMHIHRESNEGANELAKLGSKRKNMVASWV